MVFSSMFRIPLVLRNFIVPRPVAACSSSGFGELAFALHIQFTAKKQLCKERFGNFSLVFSCCQKTFKSFVQFRHSFSF